MWSWAFVVIVAFVLVDARIDAPKTTPMHKVLMTQRGYIQVSFVFFFFIGFFFLDPLKCVQG